MTLRWKLVTLASTAALCVVPSAAADASASGAKKCPKGKARVTIAGKSACRPLAQALPKRRAGNDVVPLVTHGLGPTWGETRDGPATLTQLVGPETKQAIDSAVSQMLARLGGLGGGRFAAALRTAAKCNWQNVIPDGLTLTDTYKQNYGDGSKLEAKMTVGDGSSGMSMAFTTPPKNGKAVRLSIDLGLCDGEAATIASCPTEDGVVEGKDNFGGAFKVEQLEDGDVTDAQTTRIDVETKLRGQVNDDAKLESIAVDRVENFTTTIDYGRWLGATQEMKLHRQGTIAMPSGRYTGTGSLDVQVKLRGLLSFLVSESKTRAAAIAEAQKASDHSWSAFVDTVVKKYAEREKNGWQKPDQCAKVDFTPRSNTLKVSAGQRGQFSGTLRATRGGSPQGKWKLTGRTRIDVTPSNGRDSKLTFRYRVQRDGGVVASFRVTSKAGLAAPKWEQGASKLPRVVTGSFSGKTGANGEYSWSGTARFVRDPDKSSPMWAMYSLENVVFTVTFVVNEFGCTGRSESRAALGSQPGANLMILQQPTGRLHRYMIALGVTAPPGQISTTCAGVTMPPRPWTAVGVFTTIPNMFYSDLKTFNGTNVIAGAASFTWSLRGSN